MDPLLHVHSVSAWLLQVLIPISGRAGVQLPIEMVVALFIGLVTALPAGTLLAPLHLSGHAPKMPLPLFVTSAAALTLALTRHPFSASAPKRLLVQHVSREVDGAHRDAGLWVSAFDPSGLVAPRDEWAALGLPAIASSASHPCDLDLPSTSCYLSFPYYFP